MASYYNQNPNYSTNTPSGSFSSSSSMSSTSFKDKTKKSSGKKTVKLSTDPQSIAARQRRHRISDRFKTLQSLVPGGSKLDTVSMLEEAIQYVKFLKNQIWIHQSINTTTVSASDHLVPDHKCNDQLALVHSGESEVSFGSNDDFFAQMQLSELPCPLPEPCLHFQGQNGNFDCFGW